MVTTDELFDLCNNEAITVDYGDLGTSLRGIYIRHPKLDRPAIGLHNELNTNERLLRCVLAEEIGHHFTGTGRYLVAYNNNQRLYLDRLEYRAVAWAVNYLVPVDKFITRVGRYAFEELVDFFYVVPQFITWQARRLKDVLEDKWKRDPREWCN